jgi:hypothetical protein
MQLHYFLMRFPYESSCFSSLMRFPYEVVCVVEGRRREGRVEGGVDVYWRMT